MNTKLLNLIATAIIILFCLPVHELAHGFTAYLFGDNTAKNAGRLTLNPRAHIDPIGLISFVLLKIGWAKPVPFNPYNLKPQRLGKICVAIAGPLSNFLMAFLFLIVFWLPIPNENILYILQSLAISNIWLGIFNLIPMLPFDGGQIVTACLPEKWYHKIQHFFARFQGVITVVFIILFRLGLLLTPMQNLLERLFFAFYNATRILMSLFFPELRW